MSKGSVKLIAAGGMTKNARKAMGMKQIPAIGVWAIDRGIGSCKWRTHACDDCYNRKCLIYPDTKKAWYPGGKDDQDWARITPENFRGLNRVRLCTRGEAFTCVDDCKRVGEWLQANPGCLFWIPTRAWQTGKRGSPENWFSINSPMVAAINRYVRCHDNARVMASLDVDTICHHGILKDLEWSTMYFHRDNIAPTGYIMNAHRCRKTWQKKINPATGRPVSLKGVCRTCRSGCFSAERVDVWLKYHQ
jgi:hypothetical protein